MSKASELELHNHSLARKTCFCLRGCTKLDQAFGPWNGNCEGALEISEVGRRNDYHIRVGGYMLDYKAANRNPPKVLHPKCSKTLPFNLGYRTTKYRRGQERCVEKDFVAFQHLDSYMDYVQQYRMSKYQHAVPTVPGSVVTAPNEETQPRENAQKSGVHTKNFWSIKYDQKYMEDCCKPTLTESFRINPYGSFAHPHQHSKENPTTSTPEHKSFYAQTSQNPVFTGCCAELMEPDTDEPWIPKNTVLQHRNSSKFMHHFIGYFPRPSYSQQTSREFLALGRKATSRVRSSSQIFIAHSGRPDRILQTIQNFSKEEPRQQHQICLDQHFLFRPCAGHSRFYPGSVKGNYMHTDLKSQESATTRSPFLSKATLFSSENSINTKESLSTPGTTRTDSSSQVRFPKLPDKLLDRNLMCNSEQFLDVSKKFGTLIPQNKMKNCFSSSPSTIKFLFRTSEEKEETSSSIGTTKLKGNSDDGNDGKLEFNGGLYLEMPKKWEDEYLDHTPKKLSATFPYPQRLFSMESVNRRLLEHGIVIQVKDTVEQERTAYAKHEKYLEEGKPRMEVADDEVESAFGILHLEKQDIRNCIKKTERPKHKIKKRSKVFTGKSGPTVSQQHACKSNFDHRGTFTEESHPVELCYGE